MLLNSDYIGPAELTGYGRAALADLEQNQFRLSRHLPTRTIDDLQYRFTAGGSGLAEAATFRAYDAESSIGSREGASRVTGELPPVSRKVRLGEYDRLRQRQADEAIADALLTDAERMTRAVAARVELARGEVLSTGQVAINENGIVATANFGRAASHDTAPATLWSDTATSTVLTDLITWSDRVADAGGDAAVALVSTEVARLMQRNAEVIGAVGGSGKTRVSFSELNDILESEGLPRVERIDEQVSVDGTTTRVIPKQYVVLVSEPTGDPETSPLGATLWGTTAESLEEDFEIAGDEPGIAVGAFSTWDPVAIWTKAAGISLPVLANPNLSLSAAVIAP